MVYIFLLQKLVFECTILVIVKGEVHVDCGRRNDCLFVRVQFDYFRCTVLRTCFSFFSLYIFISVHGWETEETFMYVIVSVEIEG